MEIFRVLDDVRITKNVLQCGYIRERCVIIRNYPIMFQYLEMRYGMTKVAMKCSFWMDNLVTSVVIF